MATLRELLLKVDADVSGLKAKLNSAGQSIDQLKGKTRGLSSVGVGLSASLGALGGIILGKLSSTLIQSGATVLKFQTDVVRAFQQVNLGVSTSSSVFSDFSEKISSLGKDGVVGPLKIAQSVRILASSLKSEKDILDAASQANRLYAATGLDASEGSEVIKKSIKTFNNEAITATTVVDSLGAAILHSDINSGEFAQILNFTGSAAKNAGVSFKELLAIAGAMNNVTGESGRILTSSLRSGFEQLSDPTSQASKAFEAWGVRVKNARGNILPFNYILDSVSNKVKYNEERFRELTNIVGNSFAIFIRDGATEYSKLLETLGSGGADVDKAKEQFENSLPGAMDKFNASMETIKNDLGNKLLEPIKTSLQEISTSLSTAFSNVDSTAITNFTRLIQTMVDNIPTAVSVMNALGASLKLVGDYIKNVANFLQIPQVIAFFSGALGNIAGNPNGVGGVGALQAGVKAFQNQKSFGQGATTSGLTESSTTSNQTIEQIIRENQAIIRQLEAKKVDTIKFIMQEAVAFSQSAEEDLRREMLRLRADLQNQKKKVEAVQPAPQAGSA